MHNVPRIETFDLADPQEHTTTFRCTKCNLSFFSELHLRRHELVGDEQDPNDPKDKRLCKICKQTFATYRGMRQHMGKIHSATKKVKCKFCCKKFKDNYAVKYHRKQVHDKVTQVQCQYCEKVLYNQYSLKKHLELCTVILSGQIAREVQHENGTVNSNNLL